MRTRGRRRLDRVLLLGGAGVAATASVVGAAVGSEEQIARYWTAATVADDGGGGAVVEEAIDWDFGLAVDKHGIDRDVPGLPTDPGGISVSSPTAPDDVLLTTNERGQPRIRIGDASKTVSGLHRYLIRYTLPGVVQGDELAWNAVGTAWPVGIDQAELHLVAPFEHGDVVCQVGAAGSDDPCDISQPDPGHLVATVESLGAGEGVTIRSRPGAELATAPPTPTPSSDQPTDDGAGVAVPAGAAAAVALVAAIPASALVRRAGRERVAAGHATEAAFAGEDGPDGGDLDPATAVGERRLDVTELAELATTEFAPPREVTPAEGGIVHDERVLPRHKVAWLIGAAIDGAVEMDETGGDGKVTLRRTDTAAPPATAKVLNAAFGGRPSITLGSYDKRFAKAWTKLESQLETWQRHSSFWDPAGHRRTVLARIRGTLLLVVGALAAAAGGAAAFRWGTPWMVLGLLGGAALGAGIALAVRAWELQVRTPEGSGMWLRIESFRRFLHDSEAHHAEEAAARGVLREYTAWALALGEIDRWARAVERSTAITESVGLGYVYMAPMLMASSVTASTAPSSSGSGGGFSGGVGGGAGGGGGGSW